MDVYNVNATFLTDRNRETDGRTVSHRRVTAGRSSSVNRSVGPASWQVNDGDEVDLLRCGFLKIGCCCCCCCCGCWLASHHSALRGQHGSWLSTGCCKSVGAAPRRAGPATRVWHQMFLCGCESVVCGRRPAAGQRAVLVCTR